MVIDHPRFVFRLLVIALSKLSENSLYPNWRRWLLLVAYCGYATLLPAQTADGQDRRVHYYGVEEGLPHRTVNSTARDPDGLLWVSTQNGLCLLDGHDVRTFPDLPLRFDGDLEVNETGHLVCRLREYPDSIEVFDPRTRLAYGVRLIDGEDGGFAGVFHRQNTPFYYVAGRQLLRYTVAGGREPALRLPAPLNGPRRLVYADERNCILREDDDTQLIWVRRNEDTRRIALPEAGFISLATYNGCSGRLTVATDRGVFEFDRHRATWGELPGLRDRQPVNRLWEDGAGNRIYGHYDDVMLRVLELTFEIDGQRSSGAWLADIDDRILDLDGENFTEELTVGTYGGVRTVHFPNQGNSLFRRYLYDPSVPPGRFGNVMRGFVEDDAGNVYVNKDTRLPYIFRINAGTLELDSIRMYDANGPLATHYGCGTNLLYYDDYVYGHTCDLVDGRQKLRLGYVFRFDPRTEEWRMYYLPEAGMVIRWIAPVPGDDKLLVVTQNIMNGPESYGKLYYFCPGTGAFEAFLPAGTVPGPQGFVRALRYDADRGVFWFGTDLGFYRFDPRDERLSVYELPGVDKTTVSGIIVEDDGSLLLGTLRNGLYRFDPATERFGEQVGRHLLRNQADRTNTDLLRLPSNDVADMLKISPERRIIATFQGLVYQDGDRTSVFTEDHGLPDNEFNSSSLYYAPTTDRYYAGGINGFASFREEDLADPTSPHRVLLTDYRILDEHVGYETTHVLGTAPNNRLILDPSVIYCGLDFTLPDFSDPGQQRYQTRLINYDPDWTPLGKDNSVRYTRLPPGDYRFELRAYDAARRRSPNVASLNITVLKPWHETWWFRVLLAAAILLVGYLITTARLNHLRRKLENERRMQLLELESLRQQLNPHFISNALNAINEYIKREDVADSTSYLTDFSLLMRQFLESSRSRFTPLDQEIAMLRRYVRLEQLRFPDKFVAEFVIDPALDPTMDRIPSFLLQPLVENAIFHGLRPLSGSDGHLRVSFELDELDDETIICTVADNGIGRERAAATARVRERKSHAVAIMEERRVMLANQEGVRLDIAVDDQFPGTERPGTVVRIRISGE